VQIISKYFFNTLECSESAIKQPDKDSITLTQSTDKKAQQVTLPKQDAEFLQVANAFFKGALRASFFAFAI
jgi:hypothetical protein